VGILREGQREASMSRVAVAAGIVGLLRLRRASAIAALALLTGAATAHAERAWVLWEHSYEVWVDTNKGSHRRDVAWKKVTVTASKSDCDDRRVREARSEYYTLTGKGVGATLAGSEVGFDQSNTRYKHGYRRFECWPDTVDPRQPKAK
jgi:hypothetical protein